MERTIEQVLQQGVAAHNAGNFQEAERAYQAILQSQPRHPDANHNLGLIAISLNKIEAALPLFKTALEVNPNLEQFWMSYIDALLKNNQVKDAKQATKKAKKKGFDAKKLQALHSQSRGGANAKVPSEGHINRLLESYHTRQYNDAEKLARSINQQFPHYQFAWKVLGAVLGATGRKSEAVGANQTAVALSPQDAEAHNNLGVTLQELGRLDESEESYRQAIALKPDYAEAHNNLGITLQELSRLDGSEASCRQAIALKPDYAEAHNNLGVTLKELERLEEAEASYNQAIALKPDYAEAHSNLGNTLEDLERLDEALASYTQATLLNPNLASAHFGLGKVFYIKGNKDLALKSIVKANDIEPQTKVYALMLSVMEARKSLKGNEAAVGDTSNISALTGLISNPLILNRVVESELIASLYEMNSIQLNKTKRVGLLASGKTDARYGNGIVSPDFDLFKDSRSIIQKLAGDLKKIMMEALRSEIFIFDSFFNIFSAGGGTSPHKHISALDGHVALDLGRQKYSLVYYLSVGDQNCSEPGILKLYEPSEDILPCEGMITIIPASRMHSAIYGGKTDRIMIGVNFYSL
jgi:tetratricopeptide (TPR) repeat protein